MAAGLGFKTFTTGEVLTAANVNGYLMQGVLVFASAAARDAAITSPQEGQCCYLKDTDAVLTYSGSAWVALGGSSGMSWVSVLGRTSMGTGTSYTASGLSGYNQLMIFIAPLSNNGTTGKYTITFNGDTATNYFFFGGGGQSGFPTTVGAGNRFMTDGATGTTSVDFCDVPPGASLDVAGAIHILGANTTAIKTGYVHSGMEQTTNTTASLYNRNLMFRYNGTSVISSVTITATAGNFDAGFITILGSVN